MLRKVLGALWKDKRVVIAPAVLLKRLNAVSVLAEPIANNNIEDTFVYLMETSVVCLQRPLPYPDVIFAPTDYTKHSRRESAHVSSHLLIYPDQGMSVLLRACIVHLPCMC